MSFIYMTNNIGPRKLPWGTLLSTFFHSEQVPLNTTRCLRLFKKVYANTCLKSALIDWWLGVRNTQKQVDVSVQFVGHTPADDDADVGYLTPYLIVRIVGWQHAVPSQVGGALRLIPRRPRLVGTGSALVSRLGPLRVTEVRLIRVPLRVYDAVVQQQQQNSRSGAPMRRHMKSSHFTRIVKTDDALVNGSRIRRPQHS